MVVKTNLTNLVLQLMLRGGGMRLPMLFFWSELILKEDSMQPKY